MNAGNCTARGCDVPVRSAREAFCDAHWKALPRWARTELVGLRNDASRGNKARTLAYVKALLAASHLLASVPSPAAPARPSGP